MKLVTFNIRCDYGQDGENCFQFRKSFIKQKILCEKPDVICFQEVLPHVAVWLKEELEDDYYVVGCGRSKELDNEQMSVAYRKEKWNLISIWTRSGYQKLHLCRGAGTGSSLNVQEFVRR